MNDANDDDDDESDGEPAPKSVALEADRSTGALPPRREAFVASAATTGAAFVALSYAFDPDRAGSRSALLALFGFYAVLSAITLFRFALRGEIGARMRPASGDVALGAFTAGALYGLAQLAAFALRRTPESAWIAHVYLQVHGDTVDLDVSTKLGIALIAALEELVWRGLVLRALLVATKPRTALLVSSLLVGLAHLPAAYGLRDAAVGWNPLVPLAAFGCGLVWGGLLLRTKRLLPSLLAHAFFTWSVLEFPLWR